MTGKEDNYRGPAVRALCQITDVSLLPLSSHLSFPCFSVKVQFHPFHALGCPCLLGKALSQMMRVGVHRKHVCFLLASFLHPLSPALLKVTKD